MADSLLLKARQVVEILADKHGFFDFRKSWRHGFANQILTLDDSDHGSLFIQATEVQWLAKKELVSESPLVGRNCQIKVLGMGFWGRELVWFLFPSFPKEKKTKINKFKCGDTFLTQKIIKKINFILSF